MNFENVTKCITDCEKSIQNILQHLPFWFAAAVVVDAVAAVVVVGSLPAVPNKIF